MTTENHARLKVRIPQGTAESLTPCPCTPITPNPHLFCFTPEDPIARLPIQTSMQEVESLSY